MKVACNLGAQARLCYVSQFGDGPGYRNIHSSILDAAKKSGFDISSQLKSPQFNRVDHLGIYDIIFDVPTENATPFVNVLNEICGYTAKILPDRQQQPTASVPQ